MGSRGAATTVGFCAILLWSLLALFTAGSGRMPPFQLAAVTFAIGGLAGAATWLVRRGGAAALRQPWPVWLVGVGGLFGYHALYFTAIKSAPPAEAGLICYLWPLLIVIFSALLPNERMRPHYIVGALLGLAGTCALFFGARSFALEADYIPGFAAAFVAAFVWAIYSTLSRRFAAVPTDAVVGFCLVTAALSSLVHLGFETTVWPASAREWGAVLLLGLGPVGAAFYAWDHGVKHGDLRVLGAVSYLAPVLSTVFLVIAGFAEASASLALAAALITAGGMLAAKDMILKQTG
jgi:drug/metabolite transporter (DMT)-like permease